MRTFFRGALLVTAVSILACSHHGWHVRDDVSCNIRLINEFGDIHVNVSAHSSPDPLLTGHPGMIYESATSDGQTTFTVAKTDDIDSSDVMLVTPFHCRLAVRTTDGNITVKTGSKIPFLTVDTTTGNVTIMITPYSNAEILIATSGRITSDHTIDIEFNYHEEPAKYGRVVTGKDVNGSESATPVKVQLRSIRGDVNVLRLE